MWRRAFVATSLLALLSLANGCAVTSNCGGGCGESGCTDFACGANPALPALSGHMDGCGCGGGMMTPGCAAPADMSCGCGNGCACPGGGGGKGLLGSLLGGGAPNCAAPAAPCCPTCAAPMYTDTYAAPPATAMAPPALAPAPAPVLAPAPVMAAPAMTPQPVYPPPVAVDQIPLAAPVPVPAPAAAAPVSPAPAASQPDAGGTDNGAGSAPNADDDDFDPSFGAGANYYQPRTVRPVNAVPMRNGYYIQPMSGQQPGRVPMRRVQQAGGGSKLPTFYLD